MSVPAYPLFSDRRLKDLLEECRVRLLESVDSINESRLINSKAEDEVESLLETHLPIPLKLLEDEILTDRQDVELEFHRAGLNLRPMSPRPRRVGTIVTFHVPFEGDPSLWKHQPSSFTTNPPLAKIEDAELVLAYEVAGRDSSEVRKEFDKDLAEIRKWLGWIERDITQASEVVRAGAQSRFNDRRKRVLDSEAVLSRLGFPLKRRAAAPPTYRVPEIRRKVELPRTPPAPSAPNREPLEPTLGETEYEHILSVINNMVAVMERSPTAFRGMKEEDLRQHFLVQLNGQYEGQAFGETFNFEGKTDILIRWQGKNLFIAECKFWRGQSSLVEALDQILAYATWKDTKTAVLLFNRQRQLSEVLEQIPVAVKAHPNYTRDLPCSFETGFRFCLHHRDDKKREIIVTILVFEIPS